MKKMKVMMKREDLQDIPEFSLPANFHFDFFQKGEEADWVRVETAAGEFSNEKEARRRFNREFGSRLDEFSKRCLFLKNEKQQIIGTITAWYGKPAENTEKIGRIHWVSILPNYQGLGLAKPMLTAGLKVLANYHTAAYLTSGTINYRAINMYLQYGFQPVIQDDKDIEAWTIIEATLEKKILKQ